MAGEKAGRARFIDTNVILRYLLNDIPEQADAAEALFKAAAKGDLALKTNAMVIAELVWTCESYYELPKDEIRDKVLAILNPRDLKWMMGTSLPRQLYSMRRGTWTSSMPITPAG